MAESAVSLSLTDSCSFSGPSDSEHRTDDKTKCCDSQIDDVPGKQSKDCSTSNNPKNRWLMMHFIQSVLHIIKDQLRDLADWKIIADILLVLFAPVIWVVKWLLVTCKPSPGLINMVPGKWKRLNPVIRTRRVFCLFVCLSFSSGQLDVEHPESGLKVEVHRPIIFMDSENISGHIRTDILFASKDHPSNFVKLCSCVNGLSEACTFDPLLCQGISCWSNGFNISSPKPEHAGVYDMIINCDGPGCPLFHKFNLPVIESNEFTTEPVFQHSLFSARNNKTDDGGSNGRNQFLLVVSIAVSIVAFSLVAVAMIVYLFCYRDGGNRLKRIGPANTENGVRAGMLQDTEDPEAQEEHETINVKQNIV